MNEATCKDCKNFLQHYGLNKEGLFWLYCGHCTLPGVRRKRPDTKACKNYVPGTDITEAFIKKEYLSKALLEYMLRLELLPHMDDAPTSHQEHCEGIE